MRRRFNFWIAPLSVAVLLAAALAARASEVSHARIVRLSYSQGAVEYREAAAPVDYAGPGEPAAPVWQKAIANIPIREGMSLATGDGRAEVEFESGAMAWISSNTILEFPQLALADGAKLSTLAVRQGTASFYLHTNKRDSFTVRAGEAEIQATGFARFRVDVFDDGASITVERGAVEVETAGRAQRVESRKTLSLHNGAPESTELIASPALDGWDRWVADRTSAVETARYDSSGYVDSRVGYGLADLGFYGGWMMLPGYGYVWQPWGVGAGWSPFFSGYWSNFGAFGPTWVSFEPWGWLPYHYGGWVLSPFYGWVWVPGGFTVWNPATVAWLTTPVGIGWVPLAPRDAPGRAPANLKHGVVTNTAFGMAAQLPNSMLAASSLSAVRVVGAWQNDVELARLSKEALAAARVRSASSPRSAVADAIASNWQPAAAEKMPAGPAPRLARAASFQGTVPRYYPPGGSFGGHAPTSHWGSADSSHAPHSASGASPAPSAPPAAAPQSSNATSAASGATRGSGKP